MIDDNGNCVVSQQELYNSIMLNDIVELSYTNPTLALEHLNQLRTEFYYLKEAVEIVIKMNINNSLFINIGNN